MSILNNIFANPYTGPIVAFLGAAAALLIIRHKGD